MAMSVLFHSPVAISLWVAAGAVVVVPQLMRRLRAQKKVAVGPA